MGTLPPMGRQHSWWPQLSAQNRSIRSTVAVLWWWRLLWFSAVVSDRGATSAALQYRLCRDDCGVQRKGRRRKLALGCPEQVSPTHRASARRPSQGRWSAAPASLHENSQWPVPGWSSTGHPQRRTYLAHSAKHAALQGHHHRPQIWRLPTTVLGKS